MQFSRSNSHNFPYKYGVSVLYLLTSGKHLAYTTVLSLLRREHILYCNSKQHKHCIWAHWGKMNIIKLPKPTKYNLIYFKKISSSKRAKSSYKRMTCGTTSKMKSRVWSAISNKFTCSLFLSATFLREDIKASSNFFPPLIRFPLYSWKMLF